MFFLLAQADNLQIGVNLAAALLAGLASFLAPCTFITLPTFLTYLTGHTASLQKGDLGSKQLPRQIVISSLFYALGFLLIFIVTSGSFLAVTQFFKTQEDILMRIAGFVLLFFSLFMLFGHKLPSLRFLYRERKLEVSAHQVSNSNLFPFLVGTTTGLAWSPCIGPILGSILMLTAAGSDSFWQGLGYLTVYGIGVMAPLVLLAVFFSRAQTVIFRVAKYTHYIYQGSAVILLILGILLLTGKFEEGYSQFYLWAKSQGWGALDIWGT
jgi:cytochrome c-type biogenesis protein